MTVQQGTNNIKGSHRNHVAQGEGLESHFKAQVDDTVADRNDARKSHGQEQTCPHPSVGRCAEMLHHGSACLKSNKEQNKMFSTTVSNIHL